MNAFRHAIVAGASGGGPVHRGDLAGPRRARCLASREGLGAEPVDFHAKVGEDKITLLRRTAP